MGVRSGRMRGTVISHDVVLGTPGDSLEQRGSANTMKQQPRRIHHIVTSCDISPFAPSQRVMQSLSNEVQLLILGYIDTRRDLRSLCLTSQQLRNLSLPLLYHTVYLHTGGELLLIFFKCIVAGANLHIRHIRSLSFEDDLRYDCGLGPEETEALEREADARDVQMRLIISMLPDNRLRAFKLVHLTINYHGD